MPVKSVVTRVAPQVRPAGEEFKWASMTGVMRGFTQHIQTPEIGTGNIGAVVSGMPTVFARANLFKLAVDHVADQANPGERQGLLQFYASLVDEWKGLVACLAFRYEDLEVERIPLQYSDGQSIRETANLYEPKGAFGNMLFERKPLWSPRAAENAQGAPFIDVILYRDRVVGGTSPDTLLFTSAGYQLNGNEPFIDMETRKFTDPLRSELNAQQFFLLQGYVRLLSQRMIRFVEQFNHLPEGLRPAYGNLSTILDRWLREIEAYGRTKNFEGAAVLPEMTKFTSPYNQVFNHSTALWGKGGLIYEDLNVSDDQAIADGYMRFDPRDLLMREGTAIAQFDFGLQGLQQDTFIANLPLHVLKATAGQGVQQQHLYFALPLTPIAMTVFGESIGTLVGTDQQHALPSRLTATYENKQLRVRISLRTVEGKEIIRSCNYAIGHTLKGRDILLWPNFISRQWNRYFMYSEIPHNDAQFQAVPFVGDMAEGQSFSIITDEHGRPVYLAENGIAKQHPTLQAKLQVGITDAVKANPYKYEIYESTQPFKGVKFSYAGADCGYVVIRYPGIERAGFPKNQLEQQQNLRDARLGIDFGSTNTSVAYFSNAFQEVRSVNFQNRRISLLATDEKDNNVEPAVENEIFFFQNEPIKGNAIKSMLTLHDTGRVIKGTQQELPETTFSQAVKGGFPCFEYNMPIQSATDTRYTLQYENRGEGDRHVGKAEIVHNMKWHADPMEVSHKKAYLSSLLLHLYAQLFEEGHQPTTLNWSYPSAMSNTLLAQYGQIWNTLANISPIVGHAGITIAGVPGINLNFGGEQGNNVINFQGGVNIYPTQLQDANSGTLSFGGGTDTSIKQKDITIPEGPVAFNFRPLTADTALTEACAVANYLANNPALNMTPNHLTLCFDVGGSTTDITALCYMQGAQGVGLAMVKQNSIRFAAQRVSSATRYSPNFAATLRQLCDDKKIAIQGVNMGDNRLSPETAPYYFERILDRLQPADFADFYGRIQAHCPELMVINLYVTGLIMYYAGQITRTLRQHIATSPERHPMITENWKPIVNIISAGKGARLFDWLRSVNPNAATQYYMHLFAMGFGGQEQAAACLGGLSLGFNNQVDREEVKYEVSKGLVFNPERLLVSTQDSAIEILGEEGFMIHQPQTGQRVALPHDAPITKEMMKHMSVYFMRDPQSAPCPKFAEFLNAFSTVSQQLFGIKIPMALDNMNIEAYITNLPEYRAAKANQSQQNPENFDFIAPLIILEGMKFLEDTLLPAIRNKK